MLIPIEKTMNKEMLLMADRMLSSTFLKKITDKGRKAPIIRNTKKTEDPRLMKTGSVRAGIAAIYVNSSEIDAPPTQIGVTNGVMTDCLLGVEVLSSCFDSSGLVIN